MTEKEKENCKSILREIKEELPQPLEYYDERGSVVGYEPPSREALAITNIAEILYMLLDSEVAE